MRILHLLSSHRWTGAAEPATALALEQQKLGHEVAFACVRGASLERNALARGAPLVDGPMLAPTANPLQLIADIRALRRLCRERRFDVVHAHLPHAHWLACAALGRLNPFRAVLESSVHSGADLEVRTTMTEPNCGAALQVCTESQAAGDPIIVRTLHRDEPPRRDPVHRFFFTRATDLLITVTRAARAATIERLGLDESRVGWVPGAVDLDRFRTGLDAEATRRDWKIGPAERVAGIVAEMQPHRGHHLFIDTIDEVARAVPDARYSIVGSGELKYEIKGRVKSHALRKQFCWFGVRMDDLPEVYSTMNVSVLLARGSDGTCRAMLESMASGVPVIGVRLGAIAETIDPGRTGWLIAPAPPERARAELTAALIEALSNPHRTAEMGRAARAEMEQNFTQQRRAERVLDAYNTTLARRRAQPL